MARTYRHNSQPVDGSPRRTRLRLYVNVKRINWAIAYRSPLNTD